MTTPSTYVIEPILSSYNDNAILRVDYTRENDSPLAHPGVSKTSRKYLLYCRKYLLYYMKRKCMWFINELQAGWSIPGTLSLHKMCPYSGLFLSVFFPHFPAFGLNTERYVVSLLWDFRPLMTHLGGLTSVV